MHLSLFLKCMKCRGQWLSCLRLCTEGLSWGGHLTLNDYSCWGRWTLVYQINMVFLNDDCHAEIITLRQAALTPHHEVDAPLSILEMHDGFSGKWLLCWDYHQKSCYDVNTPHISYILDSWGTSWGMYAHLYQTYVHVRFAGACAEGLLCGRCTSHLTYTLSSWGTGWCPKFTRSMKICIY